MSAKQQSLLFSIQKKNHNDGQKDKMIIGGDVKMAVVFEEGIGLTTNFGQKLPLFVFASIRSRSLQNV